MRSNDNIIFIGIKISDKLRDSLDTTKASMKHFFDENNPEFLQVMQIDSYDYIGKSIPNGASFESMINVCRNVKTMIKMISPKFLFVDDALKIYAHTPVPAKYYY